MVGETAPSNEDAGQQESVVAETVGHRGFPSSVLLCFSSDPSPVTLLSVDAFRGSSVVALSWSSDWGLTCFSDGAPAVAASAPLPAANSDGQSLLSDVSCSEAEVDVVEEDVLSDVEVPLLELVPEELDVELKSDSSLWRCRFRPFFLFFRFLSASGRGGVFEAGSTPCGLEAGLRPR